MDASRPAAESNGKWRAGMGFWSLIITQFQGAFNDNLFRFLIVFFLLARAVDPATGEPDKAASDWIVTLSGLLFSIPFIAFPGLFGAISDRFSKQRVTVWAKYIEVGVMLGGAIAFYFGAELALWVLLFAMLTQSALFSPSKYGILPEILPEEKLSWGNGHLQMWTMLSIIIGQGIAGAVYVIMTCGKSGVLAVGGLLVVLSLIGTASSFFITRPAPANPEQPIPVNPWAGTGRYFRMFAADKWLLATIVGYTYFWFIGMLFQTNLFTFGKLTLGLSEMKISITQGSLALGMGLGSLGAGYLSKNKIELGLVLPGGIALMLCSLLLASPLVGFISCCIILCGLGMSAGFFYVPLAASVQYRSPKEAKGGVIATANILTSVGWFVASGIYWMCSRLDLGTRAIFVIAALMTAGVCAYMCWTMPMMMLRFPLWVLTNTLYRLKVEGRKNVPDEGGAFLTGNHTSFVDALLVAMSMDREVQFYMSEPYWNSSLLRRVGRLLKVKPFPIDPAGRDACFDAMAEVMAGGGLVCVFAEDQMTRSEQLRALQAAFARAGSEAACPVIPFYVLPSFTAIFAGRKGKYWWKIPDHIPYHLGIAFGQPMPLESTPYDVNFEMRELGVHVNATRKLHHALLHRAFVRWARRRPWAMAIADVRSGALSYFKALVGSIILGRKLKEVLGPQPMVGVMVPPSVGGALTNISLQLMGKVPVNLNYTAAAGAIKAAAEQCELSHCITAKAFLERFPVEVPGEPVYLENIMKSVTKKDRIIGMLMAVFLPVRAIERRLGAPRIRSADDLATVIFSSGSEGQPKGVMLSHYNCFMNIAPVPELFPHRMTDVMTGILPFFHSFGFTVTLWLPIMNGISAAFHASPLEARAIGELVKKYQNLFMLGTPTFLQNFIRRCTREEFDSLEYVICGAEKMPDRIRDAFTEKFGVEPIEGYGITECGPVVSVNLPDFRTAGLYQWNTKRGTVGRPQPEMNVRVVDPDTGEALGADEPGLLLVKGPNVMKGYLNMPEKTESVIVDGWYSTGDIASVDEEGFITITDRLARFSKIAGEMVPHIRIEEVFHELLGLKEQAIVVSGVPDPNKGERLVVLHTLTHDQLEELLEKIHEADLPNLWRPRPNAFYSIDEIPALGTGKMDLKAIKAMAAKLDMGE